MSVFQDTVAALHGATDRYEHILGCTATIKPEMSAARSRTLPPLPVTRNSHGNDSRESKRNSTGEEIVCTAAKGPPPLPTKKPRMINPPERKIRKSASEAEARVTDMVFDVPKAKKTSSVPTDLQCSASAVTAEDADNVVAQHRYPRVVVKGVSLLNLAGTFLRASSRISVEPYLEKSSVYKRKVKKVSAEDIYWEIGDVVDKNRIVHLERSSMTSLVSKLIFSFEGTIYT